MMQDFINWLKENYNIVKGIFIPLVTAILGIFAIKNYKKIKNVIKNSNNKKQISYNGDICDQSSSNIVASNNNSNTQSTNNINLFINNPTDALNLTNDIAKSLFSNQVTVPAILNNNLESFISCLEPELNAMSSDNLRKLGNPNNIRDLRNAIKNAVFKESKIIHQVLSKLVTDKLQKPKTSPAELVFSKSINVIEDLDANFIKILALSFIFSRPKFKFINNQGEMIISKRPAKYM